MAAIILAADHAGFALKEKIKAALVRDHEVFDLSPTLVKGDDYPDVAFRAAKKVTELRARGIFVCGSGEGMCIAANKVKGIRAGIGFDVQSAAIMRKDNDSNVLCLAGRRLKEKDALRIVKTWLTTAFSGGRHGRRVKKISSFEAALRRGP